MKLRVSFTTALGWLLAAPMLTMALPSTSGASHADEMQRLLTEQKMKEVEETASRNLPIREHLEIQRIMIKEEKKKENLRDDFNSEPFPTFHGDEFYLEDHDYHLERSLVVKPLKTSHIGDFMPLSCNDGNMVCDEKLVSSIIQANQVLEIPCGECYIFDQEGEIELAGINIKGKLHFPPNHKVTIKTPYVIVQGELEITDTNVIGGEDTDSVNFILTGEGEHSFVGAHNNAGVCGGSPCAIGSKAFIVAGGKLNIQGMKDESCPTWTKLIGQAQGDRAYLEDGEFARKTKLPDYCSDIILESTFENDLEHWDGNDGGKATWDDVEGALVVSERGATWQGPRFDMTHLQEPHMSCLLPNIEYLVNARVKLTKEDNSGNGTPTECASDWTKCVQIIHKTASPPGQPYIHDRELLRQSTRLAGNYGEWVDLIGIVKWDPVQLNSANLFHLLEIRGPSEGIDIHLDSIKIYLPSETSFLNPTDQCYELLPNGDAEANGMHPYPFRSHNNGNPVYAIKEENGNNFFRQSLREHWWSFMYANVNQHCFKQAIIYTMSMDVRIHSETPVAYSASIYGKYQKGTDQIENYETDRISCPKQTIHDGWVTCKGDFTIKPEMEAATEPGRWRLFLNDFTSLVDIDYDNLKITFKSGPVEGIKLDDSIASCWGVGADVHITSSTLTDDQAQSSTISEIIKKGDGTVSLQLQDPVSTIIGSDESEDFAVEVALISRNIKIQGDGGYLQVLHTPKTEQILKGVELKNMGELSVPDRYPIQFLYSGDVNGTDVSRNSIRDSNQRCLVLDNTSNALVSENVAYNSTGNCFYVGYESENNLFKNNLASSITNRMNWNNRILDMDDHYLSAFYTVWPPNHWIGNVAAGGKGQGFRFVSPWQVRGEDNNVISVPNARTKQFGIFSDNVAHSNMNDGFQAGDVYGGLLKIENFKSYKNGMKGLYVWWSKNIQITGGFFADNQIGVHFHYTDMVTVEDTELYGLSDWMKEKTKQLPKKHCPGNPIIGIKLPPFLRDRNAKDGATLRNLFFAGFDNSPDCPGSVPITFDKAMLDNKSFKHFNYATSVESIVSQDSRNVIIDACSLQEVGVLDVLIHNVDGSLDPAGQSTVPSAIVSNTGNMTAFASCENYPDQCIAYCHGCLGTVTYLVETDGSENYVVEVNSNASGEKAYFSGFDDNDGDKKKASDAADMRYFTVVVAAGQKYSASFLSGVGGQIVWPSFTKEEWGKPPTGCASYVAVGDIDMVVPSRSCEDNFIRNPDFETETYDYWKHNNIWNSKGGEAIKYIKEAGIDGSVALSTDVRNSPWQGLGQWLDMRCISDHLGKYYEFKANFRMMKNGQGVSCDPNGNEQNGGCPTITFGMYGYNNPATKEGEWTHWWGNQVKSVVPYEENSFGLIQGIFRVFQYLSSANRVFLKIERATPADAEIVLDNISITPFEPSCDNNLVMNGDFASGSSDFWDRYGTVRLSIVDGVDSTSALKSSNRGNRGWGQKQTMKADCFLEGDRIAIRAMVKHDIGDETSQCNPFSTHDGPERCSDIILHSNHPSLGAWYHRVIPGVTTTTTNDGWYVVSGVATISKKTENAEKFELWFAGASTQYDVISDNVIVQRLPQNCDNMVLNSDLQDGTTSFWDTFHVTGSKLSINSPGVGGTGHALRQYDRINHYTGVGQTLDARCLIEGETLAISASMKLVNSTTGQGGVCDPDKQNDWSNPCPSLEIHGSECSVGSFQLYRRFFNDAPFFQNWAADDFNPFYAEVQISQDLASCKYVRFKIYAFGMEFDLILDNFSIGIKGTDAPTPAATEAVSETLAPTPEEVTSAPTSNPTVASLTTCPGTLNTPSPITIGNEPLPIMFVRAETNKLCTLTRTAINENGETRIVPLARSYEEFDWETAAGTSASSVFLGQTWNCYDDGCQITLPPLEQGESYELTSYSYNIAEKDEIARFLESATFGATSTDINSFSSPSLDLDTATTSWLQNQMNEASVGITSHREYWRKRTNPMFVNPQSTSRPSHPCDLGSRWRRFIFTQKNSVWWREHIVTFDGSGPYVMNLDGNPVTIVQEVDFTEEGHTFDSSLTYITCGRPQETVGGNLYLRHEDGTCITTQNPEVNFTEFESTPKFVLDLPNDVNFFREIDDHLAPQEMFILLAGSNSPVCGTIPDITEEGDPPVFGRLGDTWFIFDPRIVLDDNTVSSPIPDGGGSTELATGGDTLCSNAARSFLNEESCFLSTSSSACGSIPAPETLIPLDEENLLNFLNLTGRYVYAVDKLAIEDSSGNKIEPVCTPGLRSRWKLKTDSACTPTSLGSETNATLTDLLVAQSADENPQFRDTHFPAAGVCDPEDTGHNIEILVDGQCWERVHPDLMSVYDMTYWTYNDTHMGNMHAAWNNRPHPIKKWADIEGTAILSYPSSHPLLGADYDHPITRWTNNHQRFPYVGRFGDSVRFRDLPNEIRLDQVADWYHATGSITGSGVVVCGSPGEVSNNETLGTIFDFATGRDTSWNIGKNREAVWTSVALSAPDQLRQRVAFAFSQLLVVVRLAISSSVQDSESFLTYYDIFVRNAFGNYRDILREISYSPLMAENLSYLQSRSAAYMYDVFGQISFADENFAREIMQLFSTGLVHLNIDGTPKLDENGQTILVYTNEEIMSFARSWTGFDYQRKRANVEEASWSGNHIDPMRIEAQWRDRFPKSDLYDGYIGDGYPLCVDLPKKMFLTSGARYRLLGSSFLPELMTDPSEFSTDTSIVHFELDQGSNLKSKLCNDIAGNCKFNSNVVLDDNLICVGQECDVDTVRVVKVENMFYEYVSPPCVEQLFYKNAVKLLERHRGMQATCANPLLPAASEACCSSGSSTAIRNSRYDRERMTYATATKRCEDIDKLTCDYSHVEYNAWYKAGWHWAKDDCLVLVKINTEGYAAVVYEPEQYTTKVKHIDDESRNFFKVYWEGNLYPTALNACGGCKTLSSGECMCETTVSENRVFGGMPRSIDDALSKLYIGALDPSTYDPDITPTVDAVTGIAAYKQGELFDTNTVFVFTDSKGRYHSLKNARETVHLLDTNRSSTGFSFRNAPTFMSLVPSEASARDAQYETDAVLDHYFYHDNTAPFLCIRMIQRLVSSNPSPRYIETCAKAFQTGLYKNFGSGKYGDLAAMVAAILLDREARSVILDRDPSQGSLREALLKVIGVMRSMEFQSSSSSPVVRFHDVIANRIGQMAHDFPTVFSFFLPEFRPKGRVADASLVGPEALIIDMPKTVNLLNGLFSLVKYGLSNCYGGFGVSSWSRYWNCNEGNYVDSGQLTFLPLSSDASSVVDELATLLTAGRLSAENRRIIADAYERARNESNGEAALRIAQQLILTSPEFHSTNPVQQSGIQREAIDQPQKLGINDYKAVVYLMFSGGCDSYNMIVPHTCTGKDMYKEYLAVREQVAIAKQDLLEIQTNRQTCGTFGIHPSLPSIQQLYNESDLLFFANTGVLTAPSTKEDYWQKTKTQLFAHNHMQREAKAVDPFDVAFGTGVIGRMSDILSVRGNNVGSFSIDHSSVALIGQPGVGSETFILGQNGITEFNPQPSMPNMTDQISALNTATTADSGFFAETWSEELMKSLVHNDLLHTTLSGIETSVPFPDTQLGKKLEIVAKMIDTRDQRGVDMDMFYVEIGGFDTHADLNENLQNRFEEVNDAIYAFASELKNMSVWDHVTTVQTSDFARTLAPNSGDGTDHAWGGNYMMFGGSVNGGEIYGSYPDDLTDDGPLGLGRGRLIPETPWDSVFEAVAKWVGLSDEVDLNKVCPNRNSFGDDVRFNNLSLFG